MRLTAVIDMGCDNTAYPQGERGTSPLPVGQRCGPVETAGVGSGKILSDRYSWRISPLAPAIAVTLAAALAFTATASAHGDERSAGMAQASWLEVDSLGHFGDGAGSGSTGAALFAPLSSDNVGLFFGQANGAFLFGDGSAVGGLTFGYRRIFENFVAGVNAGIDVANSPGGNTFGQVVLGAELLGRNFDLRANAYLPVTGAEASSDAPDIVLSDTAISMVGSEEVPLRGVDWEGAAKLFASGGGKHQLWARAGGFYFDSADEPIVEHYVGPTFGVEYRIEEPLGIGGSRVTFGVDGRWDEARGTRVAAGVGFRMALGGASAPVSNGSLESRRYEAVRRSHEVALGDSEEAVLDADTGVTFQQVAYSSDLAAGDLGGAVAAAEENTLLIVDEGYSSAQTIATGANMTVAGTGATLTLAGARTGREVSYTLPGSRPSIEVAATDGSVSALTLGGTGNTVGDNLHLAGLDIAAVHTSLDTTDEVTGLYINGLTSSILLDDLTITASAQMGGIASDAHVHAVYALENYSTTDDSPLLEFADSYLEARLSGTFEGSSAVNTMSEVRVYGIRSHDSELAVTGSELYAYSDADLVGGSGSGSNTNIGLYGVRGSGAFNTTSIGNSTLTAWFAGSLSGNTTPTPPTKSTALMYGLFATDASTEVDASWLDVIFDGTIDSQSSAEFYALEYEGPGGGTQTLAFTDSMISITGADSANWSSYDITSVGARFDMVGGTGTSTVLFQGNDFSGVYDTLVTLDTGYVFDGDSTGNTSDGATAAAVCYDGGAVWAGSFELDGASYSAATCAD